MSSITHMRGFGCASALLIAGLALPPPALAARTSTAELTLTLSVRHECSDILGGCFTGGNSGFRLPQLVTGSSVSTPFATAEHGYTYGGGLIPEDQEYDTLTFRTSATAGPSMGLPASAEARIDWIPDEFAEPDDERSQFQYVGFLELDTADYGDTSTGQVWISWDALITNNGAGEGGSSIAGEFMVLMQEYSTDPDDWPPPMGNIYQRFEVNLSASTGSAMVSGARFFDYIPEFSEDDLFYGYWTVYFREFSMDSYAAVIPEPATWATMIAGFGVIGAAARRRRMAVA